MSRARRPHRVTLAGAPKTLRLAVHAATYAIGRSANVSIPAPRLATTHQGAKEQRTAQDGGFRQDQRLDLALMNAGSLPLTNVHIGAWDQTGTRRSGLGVSLAPNKGGAG